MGSCAEMWARICGVLEGRMGWGEAVWTVVGMAKSGGDEQRAMLRMEVGVVG